MRSIIFAAPLALMLVLGGCVGTAPADVATQIQQVIQITRTVCGFIPTVATVAQIISAGNPLIASSAAIAQAICDAVAPQSVRSTRKAKRGLGVPTVSGVVIHGKFVN